MDLTLYLILAHFLADYPLQTNRLAIYKKNHVMGIVLHSFTHFAVSALVLLPFLYETKIWWGILIIFVTHNLFDQIKVTLGKKTKWNPFLLYILDQVGHLVVIYWVSVYYLGKITPQISGIWRFLYTDRTFVSFFLVLVLVTYFYDVSRWTYLNMKTPHPYKRDYRTMARNALIVVIAFVLYWLTRS